MRNKKSVFIAIAILATSMASPFALANDNDAALSAQEQAFNTCETIANEKSSGEDWGDIFDKCIDESNPNEPSDIENTTWEMPSSYEDMDEADMENDAAIDQ